MTDFASEFSKIFSTTGCTISGYDWNKPRFFDPNNECYAAETALMSSLTSEAYNKFGYKVEYYVKQISTKRDKLNGEDPLENVVRRFMVSVYTDNIGQQQKDYQLQGMVYTDLLKLNCSIEHFKEASTYTYDGQADAYDAYYPRIGDLMYFPWNKTFYEIINVKTFSEGSSFLAKPITFEFIVKVWKNNHEDVDVMNQNPDTMDELRRYTQMAEEFNIDYMTSDVKADLPDKEKEVPFSVSGDSLAINNTLDGLDRQKTGKSVRDVLYNDTLFDPFNDF